MQDPKGYRSCTLPTKMSAGKGHLLWLHYHVRTAAFLTVNKTGISSLQLQGDGRDESTLT